MDTKKWTTQIDEITNTFRTEFRELTSEQLNWKADPGTWSIAQNIDHLIVINKTYFPIVKAIRNGTYSTPWISKLEFLVNFFGKFILDSVKPDRRRKMKTFPIWQPSQSHIPANILDVFSLHQIELKEFIATSSDLLDKRTVISSPANRNIVYRLETAFDIIVTHERRHLEQARESLQHQRSRSKKTAAAS